MKEEGVKKVNMSILETEIDLITSIKNDFAIFENSSDLPVLDYPSRLEMGMMAICLRGTTRMSIDLKEYTFGANDMVIVLADQIVQQHQRSDDFLCCVFAVSIKFAQEAILSYRQFLPTLLRIKEDPRILLNCSSIAKGYGFRSGILFVLAPESQHARQLFPSRDRQEPVPCSFLRIGQYHEPSCSRRRTAGENASGRSVRTVHSSGPGSL